MEKYRPGRSYWRLTTHTTGPGGSHHTAGLTATVQLSVSLFLGCQDRERGQDEDKAADKDRLARKVAVKGKSLWGLPEKGKGK